jgi:hypothetical protein
VKQGSRREQKNIRFRQFRGRRRRWLVGPHRPQKTPSSISKRILQLWLPSAYFVVEACPRPAEALEIYCEIMEDWADNVIAGADLSESYPVSVEPTIEHADMLKGRIDFIRKKLIPRA